MQIVADPEAFTLHISFVDVRGRPTDVSAHEAEMRKAVQAHLDISWDFRYLTCAELANTTLTCTQVEALGLTCEQLMTWSPP